MIKWNEAVFDRADEDLMVQINREQDDEFGRKLRAALRGTKLTSALPGRMLTPITRVSLTKTTGDFINRV